MYQKLLTSNFNRKNLLLDKQNFGKSIVTKDTQMKMILILQKSIKLQTIVYNFNKEISDLVKQYFKKNVVLIINKFKIV